jgi:hypothetical protein
MDRVVATTATASRDPKLWEVLALFNLGCGRRRASRACRLKLMRQLNGGSGWERRLPDLAAVADAAEELAKVLALPLAPASPPAPPPLAPAASSPAPAAGAGTAAVAPVAAAAPEQTPSQEAHTCLMLVRSAAKRADAFGGVGASGDPARAQLKAALAAIEELVA